MMKRWGLASKYEHPGIYSISIGSQIVYIGKSTNMLRRLAQHWVGIKISKEHKYKVLAEAKKRRLVTTFDVMYYAKETSSSALEEELGRREGELIRAYEPPLNS